MYRALFDQQDGILYLVNRTNWTLNVHTVTRARKLVDNDIMVQTTKRLVTVHCLTILSQDDKTV